MMDLRNEKILKRESGGRVKISVELRCLGIRQAEYSFHVLTCGKGRRTWQGCVNTDDYGYRRLSMEGRRAHERTEMMKVISTDELHQAKLELWRGLEPVEAPA